MCTDPIHDRREQRSGLDRIRVIEGSEGSWELRLNMCLGEDWTLFEEDDATVTLTIDEASQLAHRLLKHADHVRVQALPKPLMPGEYYQVIPTGMFTEGFQLRATGEILVTVENTYHEFVNWWDRLIWVRDSEVVQLWSKFVGES